MCKKFQQLKNIGTLYGHLPQKIIAKLKPCKYVHIELVVPYANYIRQQHPGGAITKKDVILTFMKIIDPDTGWLEVAKVPCFNLEKVVPKGFI